jgi:ankyrin repeat protein
MRRVFRPDGGGGKNPNPAFSTALVEAGAEVNIRNVLGVTPLMLAAGYGADAGIVSSLIGRERT